VEVKLPAPTTVTVPVPAGAAHVPSPRQNVEEDAEVPEFRCVTARFPVTSAVAKFTALLVAVWVPPATCRMPTAGEDATMQVAHAGTLERFAALKVGAASNP